MYISLKQMHTKTHHSVFFQAGQSLQLDACFLQLLLLLGRKLGTVIGYGGHGQEQ